ncbi:MAG: zf-HC2 domain-containing protein [Desulfobacterales bacterium]|jgi:anti-sigma factor RsiW
MSNIRHDHRHCLELFDKLSEYLDNELDEATCKKIEKHVKECVACFVCLQTLRRTVDLCKKTADRPVPRAFSKKLWKVIHNLPKTRPA